MTNTGNVPASSVVLTDPVPNGTVYVAGSLAASVAFTGLPLIAMGAMPSELICVNKSVTNMLEALNTLESVLKQKLSVVDCQISPTCLP